jgi:hypothetical protein
VPTLGRQPVLPGLTNPPLVFHGGSVMHGVHLHTVFWAPSGYAFPPSPGGGIPSYEGLVQRFFADAAGAPSSAPSALAVTDQYGDQGGVGSHALRYAAATDSVDDADRYPSRGQCSSPLGLPVCLTTDQVESELDRVVSRQDPAGRGLHDLWVLLLPPNVDTCVMGFMCGTSAFAGYHSQFDLGHGSTVYALVVNPLDEGVPPQGADPQGNPVAEVATNIAAHEVTEAVSDPEGTGWIDPSGGEVGDKCQASYGAPLGYAGNGDPYNQLLSGDPFLIQTMWSNVDMGCVAHGASAPAPSLPSVALRQFSAVINGNIGATRAGVTVRVDLSRTGLVVAAGHARTGPHGGWTVTLRSPRTGAPVAVGDDRDELDVAYGHGGPPAESILTGQGGNPAGQAGYTGWSILDSGFAVSRRQVAISPCSQVGVLALTVDGHPAPPPVPRCQTASNQAVVPTAPIGSSSHVLLTSTDNRAASPDDPQGALVRLTIPLGEPGSVAALGPSGPASPGSLDNTGFPSCSADLSRQSASCTGLVPGHRYRALTGRLRLSARADPTGQALFAAPGHATWLRGGTVLTLTGPTGRVLSALHVAHLRVALTPFGDVTGGICQPGEYWGPNQGPPTGSSGSLVLPPFLLVGVSQNGPSVAVCPLTGHATGLPTGPVAQTDSFSGGSTTATVPSFSLVSPGTAATLYGPFIALARITGAPHGGPRPTVSLHITRSGSSRPVVALRNVATPQGVAVGRLRPGLYHATWTLTDRNSDTRTLHTYFVQEP